MNDNRYVRTDAQGVLRVGRTRVMLDSIVAAFWQGHSAETIQQQYPALGLSDVYGAIAYYLDHRDEVDAYLRRQEAVWEEWQERAAQRKSPVIERLRASKGVDITESS